MGKPCKRCGSTTRPTPHPGPRCATCHRAVTKERKAAAHEAMVQRVYGLKPGEYEKLYAIQGGTCAICQRATGATKSLAVDHDHKTGEPRGLLCSVDNRMLGHFRDDPNALLRAAAYLLDPPYRRLT